MLYATSLTYVNLTLPEEKPDKFWLKNLQNISCQKIGQLEKIALDDAKKSFHFRIALFILCTYLIIYTSMFSCLIKNNNPTFFLKRWLDYTHQNFGYCQYLQSSLSQLCRITKCPASNDAQCIQLPTNRQMDFLKKTPWEMFCTWGCKKNIFVGSRIFSEKN